MSRTFTKQRADAPPGFFECEAAGLDWLRVADGPRVAQVRGVSASELQLEFVNSQPPSAAAAFDFGRRLAALHSHVTPGRSEERRVGKEWRTGRQVVRR